MNTAMPATMPDDHNRTHTNSGRSFAMGLLAGSAIGAGLAICLAPRVAAQLRERIAGSVTGLRQAVADRYQQVTTRVADAVDRVADVADGVTRKGQEARDDVADAVARGAHPGGRGAREVVRGAREVEQFAMASKTDHASQS